MEQFRNFKVYDRIIASEFIKYDNLQNDLNEVSTQMSMTYRIR